MNNMSNNNCVDKIYHTLINNFNYDLIDYMRIKHIRMHLMTTNNQIIM
jgi:hypothetical protein